MRGTFSSEVMLMSRKSEKCRFGTLNLEYLIVDMFLQGNRNI